MSIVRFGLFEFDARTGELRREGEAVKLAPQPARVLNLLLSKPGDVVLREEFQKALWGDDTFVDFERGLNFCILQVRTALGDSSDNPRFIQTVPRRGYRFIAPVADARVPRVPRVPGASGATNAADPSAEARDAATGAKAGASRRRTVAKWAAALAAAAVIVLPVLLVVRGGSADPRAGRVRVAVLPFTNLTGDPGADYIADGMTDELIAQLGRVSPQRLGVIARTSVMRYRQTSKSVADIGHELGVAFVIEGSVRREESRLRVSTELIDVSDQTQAWADTFERTAAGAMDLQADVATRVARALSLELLPAAPPAARARGTSDAEAWDAYLLGRYWLTRGSPAEMAKALDSFEAAVARDPTFAAAWAEIAEARHALVMTGGMAPLTAYPRAREAARQALALDRALPEAHRVLGSVQLWHEWQPDPARESFERALQLNPSDAVAHHDYAWSLAALGRRDEAVAEITAARDLDPLSVRANTDIGWLHLHLRRPADAARACQRTLTIQPDSVEPQACLERAYAQLGRFHDALSAARAGLPANIDAASLIVNPNVNPAGQLHDMSRYTIAVYRVLTGDHEGALVDLEDAFERREPIIGFLRTDPAMDALRRHARFHKLLDRVEQARAGARSTARRR